MVETFYLLKGDYKGDPIYYVSDIRDSNPEGEFVKYEDYKKLEEEFKDYQARCENVQTIPPRIIEDVNTIMSIEEHKKILKNIKKEIINESWQTSCGEYEIDQIERIFRKYGVWC